MSKNTATKTTTKNSARSGKNAPAGEAVQNDTAPVAASVEATVEAAPAVVVGTSAVSESIKALKGTPSELIAAGILLNGTPMDAGSFTFLRKYQFKKAIETAGYMPKPKGQKGKAQEIVQLINNDLHAFSFPA